MTDFKTWETGLIKSLQEGAGEGVVSGGAGLCDRCSDALTRLERMTEEEIAAATVRMSGVYGFEALKDAMRDQRPGLRQMVMNNIRWLKMPSAGDGFWVDYYYFLEGGHACEA